MDSDQWPKPQKTLESQGIEEVKPTKEDVLDFNTGQVVAEKKPRPKEKALNCPRCNSINTKFCYYNNYSLSQPRYFCKSCKRYWTQGGTLRNVPVGGGSRKHKRPFSSSTPSSSIKMPSGLVLHESRCLPSFGGFCSTDSNSTFVGSNNVSHTTYPSVADGSLAALSFVRSGIFAKGFIQEMPVSLHVFSSVSSPLEFIVGDGLGLPVAGEFMHTKQH